jgi:hypothetical protein
VAGLLQDIDKVERVVRGSETVAPPPGIPALGGVATGVRFDRLVADAANVVTRLAYDPELRPDDPVRHTTEIARTIV